MTDHSRHFAFACGLALLAALVIPSLDQASAASYQKCYQRWATAYDKNASTAYQYAIAKWSTKAMAYLGTPSATWQNASHRKKKHKQGLGSRKAALQGECLGEILQTQSPLEQPEPCGRQEVQVSVTILTKPLPQQASSPDSDERCSGDLVELCNKLEKNLVWLHQIAMSERVLAWQ